MATYCPSMCRNCGRPWVEPLRREVGRSGQRGERDPPGGSAAHANRPVGQLDPPVPVREDPRDVLVARDDLTLAELPTGSTVGTGAARRSAQLRALGLGLNVVPVRGNVDTRLRKVHEGELDAVVVARAGVARLGRLTEVTETIDPSLVTNPKDLIVG